MSTHDEHEAPGPQKHTFPRARFRPLTWLLVALWVPTVVVIWVLGIGYFHFAYNQQAREIQIETMLIDAERRAKNSAIDRAASRRRDADNTERWIDIQLVRHPVHLYWHDNHENPQRDPCPPSVGRNYCWGFTIDVSSDIARVHGFAPGILPGPSHDSSIELLADRAQFTVYRESMPAEVRVSEHGGYLLNGTLHDGTTVFLGTLSLGQGEDLLRFTPATQEKAEE